MTTELHSFQHETELPESVQILVGLLGRPLPRIQDLMSLSSMSPLSLSQLQQIPEEAHSISLDESKLSSVANTVLLTSAAIKESMDRGIGPSHTIHHWFTLIKIIAHVTYRGAEVIGDVPIVYPSGFHIERGVASMLVTLPGSESLLSEILRYYSEPEEAPNDGHAMLTRDELMPHSGKSSSGQNDNDSMEDDDVDDSEENLSETSEERDHRFLTTMPAFPQPVDIDRLFFDLGTPDESEPQASPFLEFPLSAHILPGRCTWPNLPFPVLCLTSDNIIPLLASVAYQRRTWGIELPAVGFQLSETGSLVHTYIAWIDQVSDSKCMPTVHLLCPAVDEPSSSALPQGVFDLSNPQSSLKFSQFILSLDYQFDTLRNELPSKQRLSDLKWRSDDDIAHWSADIHAWRTSINASDGSSTTGTSTTSLPHTPTSGQQGFASFPIVMAPGSDAGSAGKKKGSKSESVSEAKSCSGFAKEKSKSILDQGSITSFMAYRYAFSLARVFHWDSEKYDPPEFQSMLSEYERISCFAWPSEWKDMDSMPVTNEWAKSYVEDLFNRYQAQYSNVTRNGEKVEPDPLDATFTDIIGGRLSLLMKSTEGSCVTESRPVPSKEAECRHNFDALFLNFFVESATEGSSREVLQIRLAENTLLRKLQDNGASPSAAIKALGELEQHFDDWERHNADLTRRVRRGSAYTCEFEDQCGATAAACTALLREISGLSKMEPSAAQVQVSKQPEPDKGTCDALLASIVEIPVNNRKHRECSEAYNNSKLAKLDILPTRRRPSQTSPSYEHPFSVHSGDYARNFNRSLSLPEPHFWLDTGSSILVFLPALLAEYKKTADNEVKAINQARMYLIAAISYFAAIGITEYPVFILAAHGSIGGLMIGWKSSNGAIYFMERNIRKFDIKDLLQAFHLAIIIMRLRKRGDELKEKVLTDKSIQKKIFSKECQQWAMSAKASSETSTKLPTLHESADS